MAKQFVCVNQLCYIINTYAQKTLGEKKVLKKVLKNPIALGGYCQPILEHGGWK